MKIPSTRTMVIGLIFLVVIGLGIGLLTIRGFSQASGETDCVIRLPDTNRYDNYKHGDVGKCIELEIAQDKQSQSVGLSKYEYISEDFGMQFNFTQPSPSCIWMKDMNFAIDIVWLDEQKQIVKIESEVKPDSYPNTFCSETPSTFVIELSSGVATRAGLELGQTLNLQR